VSGAFVFPVIIVSVFDVLFRVSEDAGRVADAFCVQQLRKIIFQRKFRLQHSTNWLTV
jgi:hypothetical protein